MCGFLRCLNLLSVSCCAWPPPRNPALVVPGIYWLVKNSDVMRLWRACRRSASYYRLRFRRLMWKRGTSMSYLYAGFAIRICMIMLQPGNRGTAVSSSMFCGYSTGRWAWVWSLWGGRDEKCYRCARCSEKPCRGGSYSNRGLRWVGKMSAWYGWEG